LTANATIVNTNAAASTARQQNVWHFKTRAAAEKKKRELESRGHVASVFKNLRSWSVTTLGVDRSGTSTVTTTRSGGENAAAVGAGCESMLRNVAPVYFPSRSLAADMYNVHLRQGDCAKMWDAGSNGWALAVKAVPGAGSRRGAVTTTKTRTTTNGASTRITTRTVTTPAGIPRGANISYFPDRSTADAIYRAALRQGDWAKMWDAGSRGWAVAIKVR